MNSKGNELFFAIEDIDTIIPDKNPVSDYWPALQPITDEEGNITGVQRSTDLTLRNRIKYNWLSDKPFRLADQETCDKMISNLHVYIGGEVPSMEDKYFYKIRVVVDKITDWVLSINEMKEGISQQTGEEVFYPQAELLQPLFWNMYFEPYQEEE